MSTILITEGKLNSGKYTYAGKEKMIQWMGNSMAEKGHDVTFCTVYDTSKSPKMSSKVKCIPLGIKYYQSFILRNFNFFFSYPLKILDVFIKKKYDYVVSFGDTSYLIVCLLKKLFKYKLIVSERGDPHYNASYFDRLRRKLYSQADIIVFQTVGARDYFNETVRRKSLIIPNPILIPTQRWSDKYTNNSIVSVGRIDFWQKRQDVLVKSFAKVLAKHPEWKLNIYGSGEDMEKLKLLIQELKISSKVILHGAVRNVTEVLLENKIFILTSDFEGIPNALLEAMSLGMPVISTDCSPGGAALLIKNRINGLLVPCGDIEAIADAMCLMIEQPHDSIMMAENARISMKNFSEEEISKMWKKIYCDE